MRISYYTFPKEMTIREIALITKREIEGKENIVSVPDGISDEQLEENFSRTIDCSVSTTKRLMKKYGGSGCTQHFDRDGGLFETTEIILKGNNSTFKYNRHL